jgi:hypothetical protein
MLFILFLRLILLSVEKKLKSVSYFLLNLKFATFLDYVPTFSCIFSAHKKVCISTVLCIKTKRKKKRSSYTQYLVH